MPGNKKRRKKNDSRGGKARKDLGNQHLGKVKGEVAPGLPTSGQILGVLVSPNPPMDGLGDSP